MKKLALLALLVGFIAGSVLGNDTPAKDDSAQKQEKMDKQTPQEQPKDEAKEPEIQTKPSGVRYQDLVVGTGKECKRGMKVECHYTLWLAADSTGTVKGRKIDSSKDRNQSFMCTLGQGLIEGWSDGMEGMKEGGIRRLLVPWKLGYPGGAGNGAIPPKTNLIFEIEYLAGM